MGKTLFLQPIKGKYVRCQVDGREYEIWKVDPRGAQDRYGTEVDYDVAMKLLVSYGKIVTLTPDAGKSLDKTVLSKITAEQERLKRHLKAQGFESEKSTVDEKKVAELETKAKNQETIIAAQTKQLEEQRKAIEDSNKTMDELKAQMAELQKQLAASGK